MSKLKNLNIDSSWSLFLDRDGVINKRIMDDYVKTTDEFIFLPGVLEAIAKFTKIFDKIFIVTNQRGISRNLMTEEDLQIIHTYMIKEIEKAGGKIDRVYYCPHNRGEDCGCRKPDIGMAVQAKKDFPSVDFNKCIMVGDTEGDMKFGQKAGMVCVKVAEPHSECICFNSLQELAESL